MKAEYRTLNLGKLRSVLPDGWSSRHKTRFMREIREECNIATALHEAGTTLARHALELGLDNFLQAHGYLHLVEGGAHLIAMPEIGLSFNLPLPELGVGNIINNQDPVFTMSAVNNAAPISPLSDTHFCYQVLTVILRIGVGAEPCYLRRVWDTQVSEQLLQGESKLRTYIERAVEGRQRRQKNYTYFVNEHLAPTMLGNMKSCLALNVDSVIKTALSDLARRYIQAPVALKTVLVNRTSAFFSPRHIKMGRVLQANGLPVLPLAANHPLFAHLPENGLNAGQREAWITLIRPLYNLLSYALNPDVARVQGLPVHPPAANLQTPSDIRNDAGRYQQWRQLVRDSDVAQRCLAAVRYVARLHRELSLLPNGALPSTYNSISLFPQKTSFRTEMTAFNANTLLALVLKSLSHPWEGMCVFNANAFHHRQVSRLAVTIIWQMLTKRLQMYWFTGAGRPGSRTKDTCKRLREARSILQSISRPLQRTR